jgi:hypothetical protein
VARAGGSTQDDQRIGRDDILAARSWRMAQPMVRGRCHAYSIVHGDGNLAHRELIITPSVTSAFSPRTFLPMPSDEGRGVPKAIRPWDGTQ